MAAWRRAEARPSNLEGIQGGTNQDATMSLMEGGRSDPKSEGMLRMILADGIWTQDSQHRAEIADTPLWTLCGHSEVEDLEHVWWRPSNCYAQCGLVPKGWEPKVVVEVAAGLTEVEEEVTEVIDLTMDQGMPRQWADGPGGTERLGLEVGWWCTPTAQQGITSTGLYARQGWEPSGLKATHSM